MATDPLEVARRRLLARTAQLLDGLDDEDLAVSFRALHRRLTSSVLAGRRAALAHVMGVAVEQVTAAIGVDLDWQLIDTDPWLSSLAQGQHTARLEAGAAAVEESIANGADPVDERRWLRLWQMQIAGSEVHQVARDATVGVAASTPPVGRVMRIAEAGACDWCRRAASRGPVFHSQVTALAGSHANCRCTVTTVTAPKAIADLKAEGARAWQESGLSARINPFTSRSVPDPALFATGAGTSERLVSIRVQLAVYRGELDAGRGSDWMRERVLALEAEARTLPGP